jgi:predicted PolB exonuclease-like 3'-5' exonuclease
MLNIPVKAAADIANAYQKRIVVITAVGTDGYVHTATYGVTEGESLLAARFGEEFNAMMGGDQSRKVVFQDLPRK